VFSPSVEVVLTIAFREAESRRHAYLTLEHLLYSLAHDADGERILGAVGVDLPKLRRDLDAFLRESVETVKRGEEREPAQTIAFRRVLQTAAMHVQSAQRAEVQAGDVCAAILQQPQTHAAQLLAAQGVTRLDVLEYLSHGIPRRRSLLKLPTIRPMSRVPAPVRKDRRRRAIRSALTAATSPNGRVRANSTR